MEAILPLVDGKTGVQGLDLEFGYRYSDYTPSGERRYLEGRLELSADRHVVVPRHAADARRGRRTSTSSRARSRIGLDNATLDPCSVANAANIDAGSCGSCASPRACRPRRSASVEDIVAGQINVFDGTDLANLPTIEQSGHDRRSAFVWTPDFGALQNPVFSLDYYDIDIDEPDRGVHAAGGPGRAATSSATREECAKVQRVGGTLTLPGRGVELLTTNKVYLQAEGIELGFSFGLRRRDMGDSHVLGYRQQVPDARVPEPRRRCRSSIATATTARAARTPRPDSALDPAHDLGPGTTCRCRCSWRHLGDVAVEPPEANGSVFEPFRNIDAVRLPRLVRELPVRGTSTC